MTHRNHLHGRETLQAVGITPLFVHIKQHAKYLHGHKNVLRQIHAKKWNELVLSEMLYSEARCGFFLQIHHWYITTCELLLQYVHSYLKRARLVLAWLNILLLNPYEPANSCLYVFEWRSVIPVILSSASEPQSPLTMEERMLSKVWRSLEETRRSLNSLRASYATTSNTLSVTLDWAKKE